MKNILCFPDTCKKSAGCSAAGRKDWKKENNACYHFCPVVNFDNNERKLLRFSRRRNIIVSEE